MKIAVTAIDNSGLTADVDPHFGRSPYFAIVDLDSMAVNFVENDAKDATGGAGIKAAQTIADQGVDGVISGSFGPKAFSGLKKARIRLYIFSNGTVKDAVAAYSNGMLQELADPNNQGHIGLK